MSAGLTLYIKPYKEKLLKTSSKYSNIKNALISTVEMRPVSFQDRCKPVLSMLKITVVTYAELYLARFYMANHLFWATLELVAAEVY